MGLEHGYAHERYFVPLSARVRYLLGLCFCEHCLAAAHAAGVDGEAARRDARDAIERAFAGEDPGGEPERDEYARVREQVVTSLVAEVADAAGDTPLEFIELSGAVKGYADGRPTGDPSPTLAWQLGVDVKAVAAACDGIQAMGYAADPGWVARDLDTYGQDAVSVIFRPSTPDCDSAGELHAKVDTGARARLAARGLLPLRPDAARRTGLDPRGPGARTSAWRLEPRREHARSGEDWRGAVRVTR